MTLPRPVRVVIQARLSSSRLPAKALLTLAGMPAVELAARRAGNRGHHVVVATSAHADDDAIARHLESVGIPVRRGPLVDPLGRFVLATEDLAEDAVVVRLTADNVLPDGELVAGLVEEFTDRGRAYLRVGDGLPYGVAAEAFTAGALRAAAATSDRAADREHVTPAVRRERGDAVWSVPVTGSWHRLRATLDSYDDLVRLSDLFHGVDAPVSIGWAQLCDKLAAAAPGHLPLPAQTDPITQARLVLGTVQLGLRYGAANADGMPSAQQSTDLLRHAAARGLTHVDTARAYGASERRVGTALRRGAGEHLRVVTKVGPLSGLPDGPEVARLAVLESWARSVADLGVSGAVDALLVHRAADWHRPGVREALRELVDSEAVRLIGASVASPEELCAVLEDPRCGYVQLPLNLLDRRWSDPMVAGALERRPDVVVTARSVYLQGLLVAGESARWPGLDGVDPVAVTAAVDRAVGELDRISRADLCLAYVLGQPWVTSAVVGAERLDQLEESIDLASRPPLTAEEIDLVDRLVPAGPLDLLDPSRWSLR